jgi:hypothetical protein
VAELTDPSIVVFINDSLSSSGPQLYSGDIREVEFADHREITIQIGTALPELQTYDWTMIGP